MHLHDELIKIHPDAPEVLKLLYVDLLRKDEVKEKLGLDFRTLKRILRKSFILIISNLEL
jgi:predicted DNA-binding protein (UPF0251 family)